MCRSRRSEQKKHYTPKSGLVTWPTPLCERAEKKKSRTAKFEVCNSFKHTENFVAVQISEILRGFVWEKLAIQQLFPIQILLPFPIFQLLPNLILNATGLGRSRDQVTHKNEFYWEKNLSNKKCRMTGLDTTPYQVIQTSTIFCSRFLHEHVVWALMHEGAYRTGSFYLHRGYFFTQFYNMAFPLG